MSIEPRLTVALVQTLSRIDLEALLTRFGAVFVDEGHHLPAASFLVPIGSLPAKYHLWCSATPKWEDGLTRMVLAAGGPVIYTINQEDLPTLKPLLVIVETPYTGYIDPNNYPEMLNKLTQNRTRNSLIVKTITREAAGHYTLVLSERIDHLAILKDMLTKVLLKMSIEILTRNIPKRKRLEIITKARNKQVDILLTTQLAREGLDLPHLDRLFLVTPKRAGNAVEQEIGRIKRPCQNKHDAVIFDFWDTRNPVFKAQFWKRQAVLDGCSWPKFIS